MRSRAARRSRSSPTSASSVRSAPLRSPRTGISTNTARKLKHLLSATSRPQKKPSSTWCRGSNPAIVPLVAASRSRDLSKRSYGESRISRRNGRTTRHGWTTRNGRTARHGRTTGYGRTSRHGWTGHATDDGAYAERAELSATGPTDATRYAEDRAGDRVDGARRRRVLRLALRRRQEQGSGRRRNVDGHQSGHQARAGGLGWYGCDGGEACNDGQRRRRGGSDRLCSGRDDDGSWLGGRRGGRRRRSGDGPR